MLRKKDLDPIGVFKAEASGPDGHCVAFAPLYDGTVAVFNTRDDDDGPALAFTPAEWDAFVEGVRTGRFMAL